MRSGYDSRLSIRGQGPAVVLVPGMNGTGELFYRQVPRLEQSYRVATYGLRDDADSLDLLAGDLAHVVDFVAPVERRAIVVGESFGGAVALTFALKYPEQVAALVILNSFPYFAPQLRLRLAIAGLTIVPWGAMPLVRHLTAFSLLSTAIDMSAAAAWLRSENERRPIAERRLVVALLVKAVALALRKAPELNGHWVDGAFRHGAGIHVGCAIALRGGGLIAPAVHNADQQDLGILMRQISDLVARARRSTPKL